MKVSTQELNKLIRDKIPEILKADGVGVEAEVIEKDDVFKLVLLSKIEEEAMEATIAEEEGKLLEVLGDIETLIDALLEVKGWSREELKAQQESKDESHGKFKKRLYMKVVLKKEGD